MILSIAMTGVIAGILSAVHVIRIMRVVIILGSVMVVYNKYKSRYTMNHGRYDGYNSLCNGKFAALPMMSQRAFSAPYH